MSVTCLGVATALAVFAAGGGDAPPVVAVIDIATVFERYEMTADLEREFEEMRRGFAEEVERRRKTVESRREALQGFKPDSPDYRQREEELLRLEIEDQAWATVREKRLKDDHKRWLMQIYQDTRDTVRAIAEPRGIDLVLTYDNLSRDAPDSTTLRQQILLQKVIYANARTDLTEEVLAALNGEYRRRGGRQSLNRRDPAPATPAGGGGP